MDLYLTANIIHTAHVSSGYVKTRHRTATLTWSPRHPIISSQIDDLKNNNKKQDKEVQLNQKVRFQ